MKSDFENNFEKIYYLYYNIVNWFNIYWTFMTYLLYLILCLIKASKVRITYAKVTKTSQNIKLLYAYFNIYVPHKFKTSVNKMFIKESPYIFIV